jgi:hypothetical protein
MPLFRPDIRIEGGAQLGKVSAELKAAGNKTLQRSMRKRLRKAVEPVAEEIRYDAAEQSQMVAATITTTFSYSPKRAGVVIAAKRSKMPHGKEGLPGLFEFGNRRGRNVIRHPVYGNRENWVDQPIRPYFFKNAKRYNANVTKAMVAVLDDVEKELRGKP